MVKTNKSEDDRPPVEFRVAHGLALFYIPTRLLSWVLSHFMRLDKVFRKRKAQGAIEYLFMVAAALVIILVVVRYVLRT